MGLIFTISFLLFVLGFILLSFFYFLVVSSVIDLRSFCKHLVLWISFSALAVFKTFYLQFFQKLDYVSWYKFLCIYSICRFLPFANFGEISTIISFSIFSDPLSLSSPSGTPMTWMLELFLLSHRSLKLLFFFSSQFSLLFSLSTFYWSFTDSLSTPCLYWAHSMSS